MNAAQLRAWGPPAVTTVVLIIAIIVFIVSTAHKTAACGYPTAVAQGRSLASGCRTCHDISPTVRNIAGKSANLQSTWGATIGTLPQPGKPKSQSLIAARDKGLVWDDDTLVQYLKDPKAFLVKVTGKTFDDADYMPFQVALAPARRDLAAYFKFIKTNPQCD